MNKIGILSGGGKLPLLIGQNLIDLKYDVIFFCINNFCDTKVYKGYNYNIINLNSLSKILKSLKINNIDKIIMAGYVERPSIKDISFDINTIKLIKNYALDSKGDDKLLSSISIFFKNKGFPIFNWKSKCKKLFFSEKDNSKIRPSIKAKKNKEKGLKIFRYIGKADLSQSIILQNNMVLGIEAAEGTDELIKRCFRYKKKGDKGILLKLSKYKQSSSFDVPVIGLNTVKNLKKYDYEGAFIEMNKCIIIDKDEVIKFCNQNNIFLSSVSKIEK